MLDIEYKGGNCVILTTKKSTMYVDPKLSVVGLKDIKVNDEVEVVTETRFIVENTDARIIIDRPGEYEVGDFTIRGIAAARHLDTERDGNQSTVYRIEAEDFSIGLLGNIQSNLDEAQLEGLGVVDILVLPVGGNGYTLDASAAATLTRLIEPKVVVPVHYADPKLEYEVPQDPIELFEKELGAPVADAVAKYRLKSSGSLPPVMTLQAISRS